MSTLIDSQYVDVVFEGGQLKVIVDTKKLAVEAIKPALEKLKDKIPTKIDDVIIDALLKELMGDEPVAPEAGA